jgi:hypothetical protein
MTRTECLEAIQRYQAGMLGRNEIDNLFSVLLVDEELYNEFAQDQIISEVLLDPSFLKKARRAVQDLEPRRMGGWNPALTTTVVAVLVMCIAVGLSIWKHQERKTTSAPSSPEAQLEANQAKSVVPGPSADLKKPSKVLTYALPVVTTILVVTLRSVDRDENSGNTIDVKPYTKAIQFQFSIPQDQTHGLTVSISRVAGEQIGRFKTRIARGNTHLIEAIVPASSLHQGDYVLTVSSLVSGRSEEMANYSFKVVRTD